MDAEVDAIAVWIDRLDVVAIVLALDLRDGGVTGGGYLFVDLGDRQPLVNHY